MKLSELFEPGKHSLVIYNFMFPRDPGDTSARPAIGKTALLPLRDGPCPSRTALLDQLDGAAEHVNNRDYHGETAEGFQRPMLNVFHRDRDTIRHFWGSELFYAPTDGDQDPRHVSTLEPLWNLFDLTPDGRPSGWYEQLSY